MLSPKTAKKSKLHTVSKMFITDTLLSSLSAPTGETKSPKSFKPCAGHPEAVQEESGDFWVFLEVLRLKLPTGRWRHTRETGLALKQKSLSCTHINTCRQTKKHHTCIYYMCAYACPGACAHTYTLTSISAVSNRTQTEQCHRYDWDVLLWEFKMIY